MSGSSTERATPSSLPASLEPLANVLAGEPGARGPIERVRELVHALPGGAPTTEPDPRRGLSALLDQLQRAGAI